MFFIVTTWLHTVKLDAKQIIALRINSFAPLHRLHNCAMPLVLVPILVPIVPI